jgi:hypothetical protein
MPPLLQPAADTRARPRLRLALAAMFDAVRLLVIRLVPRRYRKQPAVPEPIPAHEPAGMYDLTDRGELHGGTYCRTCRIPWPCMGYVWKGRAVEARASARQMISWMWANLGAAAGCNAARVYTDYSPISWDGLFFTVLTLLWLVVAAWAIWLNRLHHRITRVYERLARD